MFGRQSIFPILRTTIEKLPILLISIIIGFLISCAVNTEKQQIADIRWTTYGIPHIKADNEFGLGYGIGYAYSRDNACLLVQEIITANGERSRFFGTEKTSSAQINNLASDLFYSWLNNDYQVDTFWQKQPEAIQQLLRGYVQGFNRYLAEAKPGDISCQKDEWLRPILTQDLVRLVRSLLVEGGLKQFVGPMIGASPPQHLDSMSIRANTSQLLAHIEFDRNWLFGGKSVSSLGSNALAIGKARAMNGKGLLLANPHFPWEVGAQRFYQMHLTIPGKLDVMGAALPGLPLINIGFNQHIAWTHTVDTSSHFTLYRLKLDPKDPTRYLVGDESRPLKKITITVSAKDNDGNVSEVKHAIYESEYGPVVVIPGMLAWDKNTAFALRDANRDNTRVLSQWYSINQVRDTKELQRSLAQLQGIPWVNTVAVDATGKALYLNQSVIPFLTDNQLNTCADPMLIKHGLVVLDGSTQQCQWIVDERAAQPGIVPAVKLPALVREDYVQNSNDSAWLSNPLDPLTGFSPLVSRSDSQLGLRTRFAVSRLQESNRTTAADLRELVTDNRVYLADLIMDDLLSLCKLHRDSKDLKQACAKLDQWDSKANVNSGAGLLLFSEFAMGFAQIENRWRVPFNPKNPLHTPYGINLDNPEVVQAVVTVLRAANDKLENMGIPSNIHWGDIQAVVKNGRKIPIPGGYGELGVYNVIESELDEDYFKVTRGSSYIQLVEFDNAGPKAWGVLAYSQSSDPLSEHFVDQTQLFSQQSWPELPFTDVQIESGVLKRITLFPQGI
ncbi:bifunctional acylase PvdQ [Cellvibrio japonicus]|uniref:Penicillin amidase family protein n=1 Tax=Cellvibrio japonicus (strain Ueda107) TaxID=498211 RepID=B3PGL1_CELJU|nr:acylase [Cellvibrio japonicus]ACE86064.1 penicillin amidase family protein [Cellvibrio japonicus Ueda107]QEI12360.1 acylase [Cellvibrio japonicus]QEI15933.1 acylase [Cellvibrio japonicus]QEI19512.1 acylase [Cellvibrio japonicus]